MNRDEILKMPACQDMDLLVAEEVLKLSTDEWNNRFFLSGNKIKFSTDMSAAWEVVEYLNKNGYAPNLVNDDNGNWYLSFDGTQDLGTATFITAFTDVPELWCKSAPLAICRAALLAVSSD